MRYLKMKNLILFITLTSLMFGCSRNTTILTNVTERDANEIVVLLNAHNIAAEKVAAPTSAVGGATKEKMWNITAPPSQMTEALSILNQAGLPRVKGSSLLDLFGSQGLVPSDMQDRIRYQEGLSEQLANTIRMMDGIVDATVQITLPQTDDEHVPLTASVYIKHRGVLDNPNSLLVNKIKRLVSSAIPGLTIENVSVVTDRVRYTDLSFTGSGSAQELGMVQIWGLLIARESVGSFRAIFYTFLFVILIALVIVAWLIWKLLPILQQQGFKSLFSLEPFHKKPTVKETKPEEEEESEE